jgi:hypothetical protein
MRDCDTLPTSPLVAARHIRVGLVLQPLRGDRTSVLGRARFVPCTDRHRLPIADDAIEENRERLQL